MTPRPRPPVAFRPDQNTRFHIDAEWWTRSDQNLRASLYQICQELNVELPPEADEEMRYDLIDPVTAQVWNVSAFDYFFVQRCAGHPDYLTERTPLIEAVFRSLLAQGNHPASPVELSKRLGRPAESILATLAGKQIYKGIVPVNG